MRLHLFIGGRDCVTEEGDGFLDYDFEREGIVGAEYNPGIDDWIEE